MKIELKEITVKELVKDYVDNVDEGVFGYGGKLDIRPPYQREFIYNDKQRDAVIDTLMQNFPLNVMYWAKRENENFEVIDGQQRTISICQYITSKFSYDDKYFHNLEDDVQNKIYGYKLMIYQCSGNNSEKLKWFETINIAGLKLKPQELRNAIYHGSWVSDAKRHFSKRNCPAYEISKDFVNVEFNRQECFEKAIKWISNDKINDYMAKNQKEQNASILWQYFKAVITWVETTFTVKRKEMKNVEWGYLYNTYKDKQSNTDEIEEETKELFKDDDVTKRSGIYPYILTRDKRYLSIRAFTDNMKSWVYELQDHKCKICKKQFKLSEMEADHIKPWSEGGHTVKENCQLLCKDDHYKKSNI